MTLSPPKKVSVAELFYDLIFVYAIGKIAAIISHVAPNEVISLEQLFKFFMLYLVFWTIWTYQTVYSNRFFEGRLQDYVVLFFNLFIVIILSQAIHLDFQETFSTFVWSTTCLFISIGIQYFLTYSRTDQTEMKQVCFPLMVTAFISVLISIVSLFLSSPLNFWVYCISILFVGFFPLFFGKQLSVVPTNFEHLAERYSLFIILLFGESIIAVAKTITYQHISLESLLFFLIIVFMFSFYMIIYSNGINHHLKTAGLTLIHTHLFLFISIGLSTVLLELYIHNHLNRYFFVGLFFLSTAAFLIAALLNLSIYKKETISYTHKYWILFILIWFIAFILSLLVCTNVLLTLIILISAFALFLFILWDLILMKHGKVRPH